MGRDKKGITTINRNDMIKNCVIIFLAGLVLTSCTLKLSAVTSTQNYNADIVVLPVKPYKK